MRVHVHYFARCRELAEISEDTLTLPDGATVEQLAAALIDLRPRLARILPSVRMAVNQEFAAPASPLADGDEVALIPPVSGAPPTSASSSRETPSPRMLPSPSCVTRRKIAAPSPPSPGSSAGAATSARTSPTWSTRPIPPWRSA